MTMLQHGLVPSTGGYRIERSLRFNSADSAYLNRTPASAGNRRTWTWSAWVKRTLQDSLSMLVQYTDGSNQSMCSIRNNTTGTNPNTIRFYDLVGGSFTTDIYWSPVYRDVSAWYHIVLVADTTQSTNTNRIKLYVNGVQVTATISATWPAQNTDLRININSSHFIGQSGAFSDFADGYMTEINFIDGSALTPSSFGETDTDTGVWKPKAYSGSYGTNGFYLKFADNSGTTSTTLGKDSSGNGNNWTPNNFSVTAGAGNDSLVDSPTAYGTDTGAGGEVRGNYCTANPLDIYPKSGTWTVSNGNLDLSLSGAVWDAIRGTTGVTSGKWYWEITATGINNTNSYAMVGIQKGAGGNWQDPFAYVYYSLNGQKYNNGSGAAYGNSWTTNDVIGVAFDADAGEIKFYKNNTVQNSGTAAYTGLTSGPYTPVIMLNGTGSAATVTCNFGQRPFAYTAPSGFKALCTQNLPTPTIGATSATRANKYFDVVLRTSNGNVGGTYSTTVNMSNGALLWDKARSINSSHYLLDSVRGISKTLSSDTTGAEANYPNWFTNFGSSSFTTGSDDYTAGTTVVDWIWAANGSGSTNNAGSIQSTVSANTTAGFSIVTYVGTGTAGTIGHGLGATPSMIIVKRRTASTAQSWQVFHSGISGMKDGYIYLNLTNGFTSGYSGIWNGTNPTSTVFSVGNDNDTNASGGLGYVAYCFSEIAGYSKFGSYTGNGSTDGPFVFTGFRPRWIMVKRSSTAGESWFIHDTSRSPYNVSNLFLAANLNWADTTAAQFDILSNGFKIRESGSGTNTNGDTYVYACFAEVPTKFALAR